MQHQLDFWPAAEEPSHEQGQWENQSGEEQAEKITLLARLIAKIICPQLIDEMRESSHEQ